MKKLLVVIAILALLVSCGGDDGGDDGDDIVEPPVPQTKKFWSQRADDGTFYQLDADLLAQNALCEIWAEKGSGVTAAQAKAVADTYISNIYPKMISNFSKPITDETGKPMFNTTMDFAHWVVTGETSGRLTILLLDIKDGYVKGSNDAFVAGFFYQGDFLEDNPPQYRSNQRDMLYIDINPLPVGDENFYRTIAHEMQHLMNLATSLVVRENLMDTWIDEGLSSAAEWIYSGKHLEDRIKNFNDDDTGLIAKGNNFFVWGNHQDKNQNAVLDDYATVYLFFQWLRLQAGSNVYKEIIASEKYDYRAIVDSAANPNDDWSDILGGWLKANYDRSPSTVFGYKDDTVLNSIKRHYTPAATPASVNLYPGEGVYSNASSYNTSGLSPSGNIKYIPLGTVSGTTITSGALLTFNASTTVTNSSGVFIATPELGTITGAAPPANIISSGGRSALNGVPSGPFPISAGDMLRRRGYERNFFGMNNLKLLTGAAGE